MNRLAELLDDARARFSGGQQSVYDPSYVYAPWKKWALVAAAAFVAATIMIGIVSSRDDGDQDSAANVHVISKNQALQEQTPHSSDGAYYQVIEVIDGDTVDISIDGKVERLRLIGVDTPETVDPRKTVECFGQEASAQAKSMLEAAEVRLESDPSQDDRDKYGRLLRYIYLQDGTNFNQYMIAEGYAHEYTYLTPYKHQAEFKQAEVSARDNNKGLWSPSTCGGDTKSSASTSVPDSAPVAPVAPVSTANNCDANYAGGCVPNVSHDLDCPDIGFTVQVVGSDMHRFDRDSDGWGCESYG